MVPKADYDRHPAFAPFCKRAPDDDDFIGLDALTDQTINEYVFTGSRHKSLIEANIGRYEDAVKADRHIDPRLRDPLCSAFRLAHARLIDEKAARTTVGATAGVTAAVRSDADRLYNAGYFLRHLPAEAIARLQTLLQSDIDALRAKADKLNANGGIGQINYAFPHIPEMNEIIQDFCVTSGVYDAISAFYGVPYDRFGFVLHHSSPQEEWIRVFDDIGMAPAKTLSLHFDAGFGVPKAMLYLNDVAPENGAFSLVPRETPFENIVFEVAFGKELLGSLSQVAGEAFDWTHKGNESVFRCVPMREIFASLPHSLRRTCNVGDHLLDGSAVSEQVMRREVVLEGSAGFMPVFLGSHALHRGGFVQTGERIALQLNFYPRPEAAPLPVPEPVLEPVAPEPAVMEQASEPEPAGIRPGRRSIWDRLRKRGAFNDAV